MLKNTLSALDILKGRLDFNETCINKSLEDGKE